MGRGRCRFFDPESLEGDCRFGSNCRHAHPNDSDWATALPARVRPGPSNGNSHITGSNTTPWTSNGRYGNASSNNSNSNSNQNDSSGSTGGWGAPSSSSGTDPKMSMKDTSTGDWDRFGAVTWGEPNITTETGTGWGPTATTTESTGWGASANTSNGGGGEGWGSNANTTTGGAGWGDTGGGSGSSPTKRSSRDGGGSRNGSGWGDSSSNGSAGWSKENTNGNSSGRNDEMSNSRPRGDSRSSRITSSNWDANVNSNSSRGSDIPTGPRNGSFSSGTTVVNHEDRPSGLHQSDRRGPSFSNGSSSYGDPRRSRGDSFNRHRDDRDVDMSPASPTTPVSPRNGYPATQSRAPKEMNGFAAPVSPLKRKRSEHEPEDRAPKQPGGRPEDKSVDPLLGDIPNIARLLVKEFVGLADARVGFEGSEKAVYNHQQMITRFGKGNVSSQDMEKLGRMTLEATDKREEYSKALHKMVKLMTDVTKNIWSSHLPPNALPDQLAVLKEGIDRTDVSTKEMRTAVEDMRRIVDGLSGLKDAQPDVTALQAALDENDKKHQARLDEALEENKKLQERLAELEERLAENTLKAQKSADDATLGVLLLKQTMISQRDVERAEAEKTMKEMEKAVLDRVLQQLRDAGVSLRPSNDIRGPSDQG